MTINKAASPPRADRSVAFGRWRRRARSCLLVFWSLDSQSYEESAANGFLSVLMRSAVLHAQLAGRLPTWT